MPLVAPAVLFIKLERADWCAPSTFCRLFLTAKTYVKWLSVQGVFNLYL